MAEKIIYQHHERDSSSGLINDLQSRELGYCSGIDQIILKSSSGDNRWSPTFGTSTIYESGENTIINSIIGVNDNSPEGQGICVSQGEQNGIIASFKQDIVNHGLTSIAETDTWGVIQPRHSDEGGFELVGLDDGNPAAIIMSSYGYGSSTSNGAGAGGGMVLRILQHDNAGTIVDTGPNSNLVTIRTQRPESHTVQSLFSFTSNGHIRVGGIDAMITTGLGLSDELKINGDKALIFQIGTETVAQFGSNGYFSTGSFGALGPAHIRSGTTDITTYSEQANDFIVEKGTGSGGITIATSPDNKGIINFADEDNLQTHKIQYDHAINQMEFFVGGNESFHMNARETAFAKPVKILESPEEAGTTGSYGQIWVKDVAPQQLWFTPADGTSTQIA